MPTLLTNRFHQTLATLAITRLPSAIFRQIPGPDARPRYQPIGPDMTYPSRRVALAALHGL